MRQISTRRIAFWVAVAVVIVGVAVGLALPPRLHGLRPSAAANAASASPKTPPTTSSAIPTEAPTPIPTPPTDAVALQWNPVEMKGPDVPLSWLSISQVAGRLMITGWVQGSPGMVYADDVASDWQSAGLQIPDSLRTRASDVRVGPPAGKRDLMVALGAVVAEDGKSAEPAAWVSRDFGVSWQWVQSAGLPAAGSGLAWTGSYFVAVEDSVNARGNPTSTASPFNAWMSTDGISWRRAPADPSTANLTAVSPVVGFNGHAAVLLAPRTSEGNGRWMDRSETRFQLWQTDDGLAWRQAILDSEPFTAQGLGAGPYGFVALSKAGDTQSLVHRSLDSRTWTSTRIDGRLGGGLQFLTEGEGGIVTTSGPGSWGTQLLSPGRTQFQPVDQLTAALVADDLGFVGFWICGDYVDFCLSQSGLEAAMPTADVYPDTLTFTFNGDYATDPRGYRWTIAWPSGYSVMFNPNVGPMLMSPDGEVVALPGDEITVRGQRQPSKGTEASLPFQASSVDQILLQATRYPELSGPPIPFETAPPGTDPSCGKDSLFGDLVARPENGLRLVDPNNRWYDLIWPTGYYPRRAFDGESAYIVVYNAAGRPVAFEGSNGTLHGTMTPDGLLICADGIDL